MLRMPGRTAVVVNLAAFTFLAAPVALAQAPAPASDEPLAAARALFAEALRDEDAGRFKDALEKFERVRAVRDTASIEYRIGTCHEGLGEPAPAFSAYLVAQELGRTDPQSADVSRAASERIEGLSKQVARLTLVMPTPAPIHSEVRVDDAVVPPGAAAIPLAPGRHVVSATADGAAPFRSETVLSEGSQISLSVVLDPRTTTTPEPAATREDAPSSAGWLALGGGVALGAASAILLVARHDAIADLNRACPGGRCPAGADAGGLESTRSRALVEGPVGVACGAAGIALAALGVYWIAVGHRTARAGPAVAVVPWIEHDGAGLAFTGGLQ
jgi:hypothetical protein